MSNLELDGHKLHLHPVVVARWLQGKNIAPIYLETGLTSLCNCHCAFCAFEYLRPTNAQLEPSVLLPFLTDAHAKGLRSVLISGEGEPLLHPEVANLVPAIRALGLDLALTTNGLLLNEALATALLPSLTWLRVSLNAGSASTYARLHGVPEHCFDQVLQNLGVLVERKKVLGVSCTVGVQVVTVPENVGELEALAPRLRYLGVDYFSIKPYSPHPGNVSRELDRCLTTADQELETALARWNTADFTVYYRAESMRRTTLPKPYDRCLGQAFAAFVMASGEVYPCHTFVGDRDYLLGDLHLDSAEEILFGARRTALLRRFAEEHDLGRCRSACRLDALNRYLWLLRHPSAHVNFI